MASLKKRLVAFGSVLAFTLGTAPAFAQSGDPGPGWTLIDSQTVRYFVPDPSAPPGSGTDETSKAMTSPPASEWILVGTDKVKYFQAEGSKTEQILSSSTEGQSVLYDTIQTDDSGTEPRRTAAPEPPKKEWSTTAIRRELDGRSVVRKVTYKVPQYENVQYPYLKVERYKKQARTVKKVAVTTSGKILYSSHPDIMPTDAGSTRIEKREGPWGDVGQVPDLSLNKTVGRGFKGAVKELAGYKTKELEEGRIQASSTDLADNSKAGGGQGLAFTTGRGSGSQAAATSGNSRVVQISGSEKVAARGAGATVNLKALAALGNSFWGARGNKAMFYFRFSDSGSSHLLSIYAVNAKGGVDQASGAYWVLNDRYQLTGPQASSRGISAAIGGAQEAGGKIKLKGQFQNRLTGELSNTLDLTSAGGN